MTFNLAGTGVLATGALNVSQSSLTFPSQATGTLSSGQQLSLSNPGNSPVTVNSIVATGDLRLRPTIATTTDASGYWRPAAPASSMSLSRPQGKRRRDRLPDHQEYCRYPDRHSERYRDGGYQCARSLRLDAEFLHGAERTTVGSFGQDGVYLVNNGNEPSHFPPRQPSRENRPRQTPISPCRLTSTTAVNTFRYWQFSAGLPPGGSCLLSAQFTPSLTSVENAILTIADSAGTQTVALTGTGSATAPTVTLDPPTVNYAPLPAKNSGGQYTAITLTNNGTADLTIASDAVTAGSADFSLPYYDDCASAVLSTGNSCTIYAVFNPSAVGLRTGTVTFTDSTAKTYLVSLAGYGLAAVDAATITPAVTTFAPLAVGDTLDGKRVSVH